VIKTSIFTQGSSVLKKFILAISGLILVGFTIAHLLGNLLIFSTDRGLLNVYADRVASSGIFYRLIEIIILLTFVIHIGYATIISWQNNQARSIKYNRSQSAGKPSQQTIFSRSMIYTGPLLLLFIILHLKDFRFGFGIDDGYVVKINGATIRDLERLVIETFQRPTSAIAYTLAMIPLGFHLRNGFKSAWQSLGVNSPRLKVWLDRGSLILAGGLSIGFAIIPTFIYFHHAIK
jgi:succinate dehydrogenase / fumarate reductase cytochrome b subunit